MKKYNVDNDVVFGNAYRKVSAKDLEKFDINPTCEINILRHFSKVDSKYSKSLVGKEYFYFYYDKLVDVKYNYQTKLNEINEEEALKYLEKEVITGREGFFCIISSENLTVSKALEIYRKKDSVEKMIHSLKNEIEIKPLRVWSDNSIYGAVIIGFISQLIMSLVKYDNEELKHVSIKFVKNSLMNLTVTVELLREGGKRYIYANFDWINELVLVGNQGIP